MTDHAAARSAAAEVAYPSEAIVTHWATPIRHDIGDREPRRSDQWRDHAACNGEPIDLFFPEELEVKGRRRAIQLAKEVCSGCPVRAECLADALANETANRYRFGIRGGLTPNERRAMNGTRSTAEHGTERRWHAHRRAGEQPCEPCRQAHNRHQQDWKRRGA